MDLPPDCHVVRLCGAASLGSDGEVTAAAFKPHLGNETRAADTDLSVHWLEYLGEGTHSECLQRLRAFINEASIPGERKLSPKGVMAVLNVDRIQTASRSLDFNTAVRHMPRINPCEPGLWTDDEHVDHIGVNVEAAKEGGLGIDPHSGICTMPQEAIREFAFQAMLADQVVHSEPCRPS